MGPSTSDVPSEEFQVFADIEAAYGELFGEFDWSLSESDMHFYQRYEGLFIVLLSRFATQPSAWAAHEMSTHYFNLVNWAEGKLQKTMPAAVFSHFLPHDPSSFALYLASKRRRIPYIFLDAPRVANVGRYLACSYSNRMLLAHDSSVPESIVFRHLIEGYSARLSEDLLANRTRNFLRITSPSTVQAKSLNSSRRTTLMNTPLRQCRRHIRSFFSWHIPRLLLRKAIPSPPIMLKSHRGRWARLHSRPGRIYWLRIRLRQAINLRKQKRQYERIAKSCHVKDRYLLLALSSQPEGSTLPAALHQRDWELLIHKLLRALPGDVQILIKAHPMQFVQGVAYTTAIDWLEPDYYRELVAINESHIALASLEHDPQTLLDESIGVVVINGSLGFEALSRGKRVIHTSPIWYQGADGAHLCSDVQDFEDAIQLMLDGTPFSRPNLRFADSSSLVTGDPDGQLHATDTRELAEKFVASLRRFETLPLIKWEP